MRWTSKGRRGIAGLLALAAVAACEDLLPTATGEDRFPDGATPTTLEIILPAEAFVLSDTVFDGYADPRTAPFLLVAEDFGGALDAHLLARPTGFPDSVSFTSGGSLRTDSVFTYGPGRVTTLVTNDASASGGPARLQLWSLAQAWDSATVTWDTAGVVASGVERWRVPGGTPGRLLAEAVWTPGDTAAVDSLTWTVDSLAVAEMARDGFPGLLVTSATAGSRVELSRLAVEATLRPASRPDTVLTRTVSGGTQAFVFTPAPPSQAGVYRVGGLTDARTQLRLDLSRRVPGCSAGSCADVPLSEVTLNRAQLLLRPLAIPSGFRPVGPTPLYVRRVVETELGRLAPLAETFSADTIPTGLFLDPAGGDAEIELTGAVASVLGSDSLTTTVALLGESGARQFGYLWFAERPRLRLIYTLPLRPALP